MMIDLRQVVAAILTFSMFIMLGNMIKRDHIDPLVETIVGNVALNDTESGPWKDSDEPPRHCWKYRSLKGKEEPNGYIFFSMTHGPEYHTSEVMNAVAVAKQLGATLIVPAVIETTGHKRDFNEIYNVESFIMSLAGIVQVEKSPPVTSLNGTIPVIEIPEKASEDVIALNVKPIFRSNASVRIVTRFNSPSGEENQATKAYQCLAMYDSLKLKPALQELADSALATLRGLSKKSNGRFVSVDISVENLETTGCQEIDSGIKKCHDPEEISEFLQNIGFHKDTTVYFTQKRWHRRLDSFRNAFPRTFTKDALVPADQKAKFTNWDALEYEKFIDFYMCTQGDVFVPAFKNKFYEEVVGKRIELGKTQILIPTKNASAAAYNAEDYISPYVAMKNHFVYSCFC